MGAPALCKIAVASFQPKSGCVISAGMTDALSDLDRTPAGGTITVRTLYCTVFVGLVGMQSCLWSFLGMPGWWSVAALVAAAVVAVAIWRADWAGTVSAGTLGVCLAVAVCLMVLGGEGRFVYATTDWQVRDAVLGDLGRFAWPFAYDQPGGAKILRAPLGMYLPPALVGKWAGSRAAELALLVQNSVLAAVVLALGSDMFTTRRAKLIGLGVFIGFSGMDVIGQLLIRRSPLLHLDGWAGMQYSSHVTQAFWVPQHALAGWIFAVLYLLWIRRGVPAVAVFAVMPLLALLSPLALIGCVPFAAHVFVAAARRGALSAGDVLWPVLAGAVCLPGLLYLVSGSASVGAGAAPVNWPLYVTFLALEVGGYCYALWLTRAHMRFGAPAAIITVVLLLVLPLVRIGESFDLTARASIPALAILAVMMAAILTDDRPAADAGVRTRARRLILVVFVVGLATPLGEIARALVWPTSPGVQCSYIGVVPGGAPTYVAPLTSLPWPIRPATVHLVRPVEPAQCWNGPWPSAATGRNTTTHLSPDKFFG
jgi:hypothetical protein